MDVTRESSPRPDSLPHALPELYPAGATQLSRAVANAAAKPLIRSAPPFEDELERTAPQPLITAADPGPGPQLTHHARTAPEPGTPTMTPSDTPSVRRPPRGDPRLREQPAFALPGWIAVLVLLAGAAGAVAVLARAGVIPPFEQLPDIRSADIIESGVADLSAQTIATVSAIGLLILITLSGLLVNAGGETRILTRWGRYRGTVRRTGLLWVNPLGRRRRVDVRLRHWRSDPVHVTDRAGTPIVVRLLIVWRVKDTARATLAVAEHETYLREQVHAVLTRTASTLPCDSDPVPGPALRDGQWFADELTRALAAEAAPAGLEVYSAQPLTLDYAPEVAESMRRRRLADLDAGLRTVLVDDAVEAAALAVRRLERATAHELDQAARSALMEQLLVAFVAPAGMTASVPAPAVRPVRKQSGLNRKAGPA